MKWITTDDLPRMRGSEGFIIRGCGKDLQLWVDMVNRMLTNENLLLEGTYFKEYFAFIHNGVSCILFPLDQNVKLDMGRLDKWRLFTYSSLEGTWLSDFVQNELGGYLPDQNHAAQKPSCPLIWEDGNIFNLMEIASQILQENQMANQATEMCHRIIDSGSYDEALCIASEYVNISSTEEEYEENYEEGPVLS